MGSGRPECWKQYHGPMLGSVMCWGSRLWPLPEHQSEQLRCFVLRGRPLWSGAGIVMSYWTVIQTAEITIPIDETRKAEFSRSVALCEGVKCRPLSIP